jgi:uncharacterized protein (TIGR03066 family)
MRMHQIPSGFSVMAVVLTAGLLVAVNARAAEPTNKEKILGTWELVKTTEKDGAPAGSTVEFMKDGKAKLTIKADKPMTLEVTYTVDGDTLKIMLKGPDGKEVTDTMKITKLTDKELVTEEKSPGQTGTSEFKKK